MTTLSQPDVEPSAPQLLWAAWTAGRDAALAAGARRQAESATDIAHNRATTPLASIVRAGLDKQPRDLELPPWLKGRYGTAIGRLVLGVL